MRIRTGSDILAGDGAVAEYMTGPYRAVELDAGHFLVQEAPHAVAEELCAHLRQNPL